MSSPTDRDTAGHPSPAEWDAVQYHRLSRPQVTWGQKVLDRLPLRGDETVIDAGCGTGRLTAELLQRVPHGRVIALDRSARMLEQAKGYLTPHFGDRVTFIQCDLAALNLDQVADAIFSTATFHWVRDHPGLFCALYRALKPGGLLVAQCGGGPNLACLMERATAIMASPAYAPLFAGWPSPWEYADAKTTAQRLRAAGFTGIETSLEPAPVELPNAEEYRAFLETVIFRAHLERIPGPSLRAGFLQALTEQAARDHPPFLLDYWRLNMLGSRPAGLAREEPSDCHPATGLQTGNAQ